MSRQYCRPEVILRLFRRRVFVLKKNGEKFSFGSDLFVKTKERLQCMTAEPEANVRLMLENIISSVNRKVA